ncbi:MAG: 6,7-dimethyl-8-ribityllumazine synthase [Flavobacteriaceae bacterium]
MSDTRFLIVEAVFYKDISAALLEGATAALDAESIAYDKVSVPGVLELPAAISYAMMAGRAALAPRYDGYVALGCVIRGETIHFDVVVRESARALMDLSVTHHLSLGNGIVTVDTEAQAWARARRGERDKGGEAARAAIAMMRLRHRMTGEK